MAVVTTDASVCGAKGNAYRLRRVQDFVVLNHQLLPEKLKQHACVNGSYRE